MTERSAGNLATLIVRLVPVLPVIALIAVACAASARLGLALNPVLGFMGFTVFFMLAIDVDLQGTGDSEGIITDELAIYLRAHSISRKRRPRWADRQIQALLVGSETRYMNPKHYVLTLKTKRDASFERTTEPITVNERRGMLVSKTFDSGSYLYGGALDHLLVDEVARENYQLLDGDSLSATGFTEYI